MVNINETMLAILHDLAAGKERMTPANMVYLQQVAEELGIQQPKNSRCSNCWRDTAILCWMEAEKRLEDGKKNNRGGYVLADGVDVVYLGIRINAATITDELAENLLAHGFPRRFFTSIPNAHDTHEGN